MPLRIRRGFSLPSLFLLVVATGSFLVCLWAVLPPPLMLLVGFAIVAEELSPLLIVVNGVLLLCCLGSWRSPKAKRLFLLLSGLSLALSCWPVSQFPSAVQRMERAMQQAFGPGYESAIPPDRLRAIRRTRFSITDLVRGIRHDPIREEKGIVFAQTAGAPLRINLYRPMAAGDYPAVVIIYGGGWSAGNPSQAASFSRYLASRGYLVACIDYRHAPQFHYPVQIEDVRAALAYVQSHWQPDPKRIALLGRSAGAHLALLAAYEPNAPKYAAVVDFYGPVDLKRGYDELPFPDPIDGRAVLSAFLGGTPSQAAEAYRKASPVTYVAAGLPPTLILHGSRDHIVRIEFSRDFAARLQASGVRVALLETPWSEHAFDMIFPGLGDQLALYYVERFLALQLR